MNTKETLTGAGVLLALVTLLFGDNMYRQVTGHSFFSSPAILRSTPTELSVPTAYTTSLLREGQVIQSLPTLTPRPAMVFVQPQSSVLLVSVERTGAETRASYSVSLASDEVLVGDAYDFQDKGYTCVVFLIRGPGTFRFSVLDGAWYKYSGVKADQQAEELLQGRIQYLENHWFCKNVAFAVERMGK